MTITRLFYCVLIWVSLQPVEQGDRVWLTWCWSAVSWACAAWAWPRIAFESPKFPALKIESSLHTTRYHWLKVESTQMALTTRGHDFWNKGTLRMNQTKPVHARGFSSAPSHAAQIGTHVKPVGPQSRPLGQCMGAAWTLFLLEAMRPDERH